jgi:hypothetical protein
MARRAAWLLSCLVILAAGTVHAEASKIATALGDLRWGMSEHDVATFVKRKIDERAEADAKKTKSGAKKDQIRSEAKRAKDAVERNIVNFEGSRSRWDASPIAGEFNYGNGESMIVFEDAGSTNYYFFNGGRLWKWFKALDTSAFGGGGFKKFSASVEKKFGHGYTKQGDVAGKKSQWVEYLDRNSRLRAADASSRGAFALIFEEMATVREMASLKPQPKRKTYAEDGETVAPSKAASGNGGREEVARAGSTRRSIFADEQRTETDAEYSARRQKLAKEEREKQQRIHDRKQDSKRGEVLKPLEGINDADPLSGL